MRKLIIILLFPISLFGQVTSLPMMSDYSTPIESVSSQRVEYYSFDFEGEQPGGWSDTEIDNYFPWGLSAAYFQTHNEAGDTITYMVEDTINGMATQVLRVKQRVDVLYEGAQLCVRLNQDFDTLSMEWDMKFDSLWNSNAGGKIPGFRGSQSSECPIVSGSAYLSMGLFKRAGAISSYHKGRTAAKSCPWASDQDSVLMNYNNWYHFRTNLTLNTFTTGTPNSDGTYEMYMDGKLMIQETGLKIIEDETDTVKINSFTISLYYGGSGASYTPTIECFAYVDNFKFFTDPGDPYWGTTHPTDLILTSPNDLDDRDLFYNAGNLITSSLTDLETSGYSSATPLHTNQMGLIDAGPDSTAQVDFTDGITSGGDYLVFYNGPTVETATELARLEGSTSDITNIDFGYGTNGRIVSDTRYIFWKYITDYSIDWGYFKANVTYN